MTTHPETGQDVEVSGPRGIDRIVVLAPMQVELDAVVRAAGLQPQPGPLSAQHRGTVGHVEVVAGLAGIGIAASCRRDGDGDR